MFTDIRRICENPTNEDKEFFPHLVGTNWLETCLDAVRNYRDESFVSQFLSPTLMRKWHMFEITNKSVDDFVTITSIQDAKGYNTIRQTLSSQYSMTSRQPDIQVVDANLKGSRELTLQFTPVNGTTLADTESAVLDYIKFLWGYNVIIRQ